MSEGDQMALAVSEPNTLIARALRICIERWSAAATRSGTGSAGTYLRLLVPTQACEYLYYGFAFGIPNSTQSEGNERCVSDP